MGYIVAVAAKFVDINLMVFNFLVVELKTMKASARWVSLWWVAKLMCEVDKRVMVFTLY